MTTGPIAVEMDTYAAIKDTVHAKLSRYGTLDQPYVLALQLRTQLPPTTAALSRALLGTLRVEMSLATGQVVRQTRSHDGIFTTFDAQGRPIRRRLSAILFYHEATLPGDTETRHEMALFHNRWAEHPLSPGVFADIPQLVPEVTGPTTYRHQWLGTPPRWAQ